jgi:hypothetical protein
MFIDVNGLAPSQAVAFWVHCGSNWRVVRIQRTGRGVSGHVHTSSDSMSRDFKEHVVAFVDILGFSKLMDALLPTVAAFRRSTKFSPASISLRFLGHFPTS